MVYLIITTFEARAERRGGGAEHCEFTMLWVDSTPPIVNSQCSGLIEMGGVVIKWTEFCYAYYVLYSCIIILNATVTYITHVTEFTPFHNYYTHFSQCGAL